MSRAAGPLAPILALLLGACAAMPAAREPPLSYPPAARERMVRLALAEWVEWGRRTDGAPAAGGPPGMPVAGPPEGAPGNFPRVLAYWRAVPDDEGAVVRNRPLYRAALAGAPGGGALWRDPPWSAAFVSFVLRGAGVDRREFPPSASHATYVDALLRDARDFPGAAPFVPRDPAGHAPRPGDLACADRGAPPLRHWRDRPAEGGRFRPMHCDIVVGVASGAAWTVGGNVRDAVAMGRLALDPAGRLPPPDPADPAARPGLLVVFENRLGRLPPWTDPPHPGADAPAIPAPAPQETAP